MPQVLLLGGHGKIALHLTPLLLARSWNVTSVIRNAEHEAEILALGNGKPGKLSVLLSSLDDVKSQADAQSVLDKVKPEYVVWAAGKSYVRLTHLPDTNTLYRSRRKRWSPTHIRHRPRRRQILHRQLLRNPLRDQIPPHQPPGQPQSETRLVARRRLETHPMALERWSTGLLQGQIRSRPIPNRACGNHKTARTEPQVSKYQSSTGSFD